MSGRATIEGSHVLITGATGGIGRATTAAFEQAGAHVHTVDLPGTAAHHHLDVTDASALAELIATLPRLDTVIVNAGIGTAGLAADIDLADWHRTIEVNLVGAVNTIVPAYHRLREQGTGTIVVVSSLAGLVPTPLLVPYAATKHALVGLTASLHPEAARHGVTIITVCPGPVDTPLLDTATATHGLDLRRHLTRLAGPPLPPDRIARHVLRAVRSGRPLVIPGRAALIATGARHHPRATRRIIGRRLHQELRHDNKGRS